MCHWYAAARSSTPTTHLELQLLQRGRSSQNSARSLRFQRFPIAPQRLASSFCQVDGDTFKLVSSTRSDQLACMPRAWVPGAHTHTYNVNTHIIVTTKTQTNKTIQYNAGLLLPPHDHTGTPTNHGTLDRIHNAAALCKRHNTAADTLFLGFAKI